MILVTGGTGLVGGHLLYRLVCNKEKVRAIYRNEEKLDNVRSVFSTYTSNIETIFKAIEWIQADLLDVSALSKAFQGVTHVYHCAALVSFEPDKYHLLRKTNIEGTANIVNLCIPNKVTKLCYVSSVAALGTALNKGIISEETDWNSENDNNVYAITKYGAEMEVWRATQEGLDAVIVNPGVILGAGIWHDSSGSLFKKVSKGLKYYTSGTIGIVSVEDVVTIMIKLVECDIKNKRFVLVAENWTYKQFLTQMALAVNTKPPTKLIKPWLLDLTWKLDWFTHKFFGKRRQLTKHLCASLSSERYYNSDKIKTALNYQFKPMNEEIITVGNHFLKQGQ